MKKLTLFLAVLLIAAGCNKVQNNQAQNPQSQLRTYKNSTYGFQFQYPDSVSFVTPNYALLDEKIFQLDIPQTAYPNTNFNDAGFAISAQGVKSLDECLSVSAPSGSDGFKTNIDINGTKFYMTKSTGAAAGNRYDSVVYRTYDNNLKCFEINETIHTSNIGNYPSGSVTEVNKDEIQDKLDTMLDTFKFDKGFAVK